MERAEKYGLGVAGAGHVVLFGLLSIGFLATPNPLKLKQQPIEVTLATEAGEISEAPVITQDPATSQAPERGAPEDAAPPAAMDAVPEPVPAPAPAPQPAARPAPAKPAPKPAPAPKPVPVAKPRPVQPAAERAAAKPATAKPAASASAARTPAATRGQGRTPTATATRARGSRLGDDFLKGLSDQPTKSQVQAPRAAKVGARELASIAGLIKRQVQPCYDLGSLAGTPAMDIVTILRLQFRPDGTVSAATVSDQEGVGPENRAYARQMAELSRRAVLRCSPLKGLPAELYQGGWADFDMGFIPRQLG